MRIRRGNDKMTPRLTDKHERISLEDLVWTEVHLDDLMRMAHCRTYDLFIASDTLTDREVTQS